MIALNNHIKESLIKSYDINKLISVIYKKYHNIEYDYNQYKSNEFLFTIYFNDEIVKQLCIDGYIPNDFIDIINEFHEKFEK